MSREERRAYQRMAKKQDPYALPVNPAARARMEKAAQRRARTGPSRAAAPAVGGLSRRFLGWAFGGGAVVGLIAFSLAWPSGMPFAGYVGAGALAAWVGLAFAARALAGRAGPPPPRR
jgi:hypothetical protein